MQISSWVSSPCDLHSHNKKIYTMFYKCIFKICTCTTCNGKCKNFGLCKCKSLICTTTLLSTLVEGALLVKAKIDKQINYEWKKILNQWNDTPCTPKKPSFGWRAIDFLDFDVCNVFPPCSHQICGGPPNLINKNYKLVIGTHNRWLNPTTTTKEKLR